ncbi:cyclic di-GMP phosphodiesterase Gmr [mine drainage metagenome]|uniref:Cyclic di-GMP phosphodiesterase Gmr n=1 Tax=mine drainage metagenome TaxID=410659 RepID=A0A1J5QYH0_9ZZZZ
MNLLWRAYLAGGALVVALYLAVPEGVSRDLVYVVVGLSSVLAIVVGVRRNRPRRASAWYWMAAGQLCWVVGDGLYSWYQDVAGTSPFPSPADALYLVAYPLIAIGLVGLIRVRERGFDVGGVIDSSIVTVALGLLSWVVLAGPIARDAGQSLTARVIGVAYPAADILLLAFLVRLLVGPGARTVAFRLLTAATGLLLVADSVFAVISATSSYQGGAVDLVWLASYILWGTAALHPSMTALSEPGLAPAPLTARRLAALTVAILIAPCTLAVELVRGSPVDAWPVTLCSVALFALVVARMQLAMREVRASSDQRDIAQGDLAHQAAHDSLTQLANRAHAVQMIEAALNRAQRSGSLVGLLFVDLDHFKTVNDTHGHAAGDDVLRETARRMQDNVRAGDTVGRLGGDEFVVLVEAPDTEADVVGLAERLVSAISAPVRTGGREVVVTASIGVAVVRDGGTDADVLLYEADAAAYRAKAQGRGRAEIFDDALRREHLARVELEAAMRTALELRQFVLYYQPIVEVLSRGTAGYEALVRWNRPGHGLVGPDEFIPTAELSNLICDLGRWVLGEATRQLAAWNTTHPGDLTVAVNISGRHLASTEILSDVTRALDAAGLPADRLVLEITETVLVDQPMALVHLSALQELGVGISIDDFGTGYTSIGQMQNLSVDSIKIDRSLVASADPGADELVRLVVHAAHAFGLTVVGEGVELETQLASLEQVQCDFAQGFLFARPQPAGGLTMPPKGHQDASHRTR